MTLLAFDIAAVVIGVMCVNGCLKRILSGQYNMLHICLIVFFVMQTLPICIGWFGSLQGIERYYQYMYRAMTDETTGLLYDVFSISCSVILYYAASRIPAHKPLSWDKFSDIRIPHRESLQVILGLLTVFPLLIGVLLAPNPRVYLTFSYFNTHVVSSTSPMAVYHTGTLNTIAYISFFSCLLSYYLSNAEHKLHYAIPVLLITWVNGKRTLLTFLLLGFVVIDFLKWDRQTKSYLKKTIAKTVAFLFIILIYYVFYNNVTQKADFADGFLLYSTYFARLSNVKVAIYDLLYTRSMLDYPMENIIYDLLFFVPRSIWPGKPYGYYPYFSSYVFNGVGYVQTNDWGFQVNIWSEFLSNGGIIGLLIALALVIIVIHAAEQSSNPITYVSGSAFVILYMAYGFEHIVQLTWVLFLLSLIVARLSVDAGGRSSIQAKRSGGGAVKRKPVLRPASRMNVFGD